MSLYIDLKFINMVSFKLARFQKKGDYLFNFRCPYCKDSKTNKNKARGYIYRKENDMFYRCHKCGEGTTVGKLIEYVDPLLGKDYILEKFIKKDEPKKKEPNPEFAFDFKPKFDKPLSIIDGLMDRLDMLPSDNEAVVYAKSRQIPIEQFSRLYYVDDIRNLVQLNNKYKKPFEKMSPHPRLALPFIREDGQVTGLCLRALRGENLRYINLIIKDELQVYGLDNVDQEQEIMVVEGPIDSLFLDNSIACVGTSFNKIDQLRLTYFTMIFDNQPRNKEVCGLIEKQIKAGNKVCLWPDVIHEKDINEMILAGLSKENITQIIHENTFQGLEAELEFNEWRRC